MSFKERNDLPEDILKAIEEFERIKDTPELQWAALNLEIGILDRIQELDDARTVAKKEGREEGREEGLEQGLEQGILLEKIKNANSMKLLGLSSDLIAAVTGLDISEIEKI